MVITKKREVAIKHKKSTQNNAWKKILKNWELYLFILPTLVYFIVFHYFPMYGVQIAFKDFVATKGIWGSKWVGFEHFTRFFKSYFFWELIRNTVGISLYGLIVGFPLPIILALGLNELKNGPFKKIVQTTTYAPYFISLVVMGGMIIAFLSPTTGIINKFLELFNIDAIPFLSQAKWFKTVYVLSGVWQGTGWGSIIYLAALAGVDPQLHEAAIIDGANRIQRIWHINMPSIVPTMVVLLILSAGGILSVGFEKILLLQNPLNTETSEVISTYVYRTGLLNAQYSFSAAVGLFNSVVNFIILILVNWFARNASETSLW